jgi:hypothetical protein
MRFELASLCDRDVGATCVIVGRGRQVRASIATAVLLPILSARVFNHRPRTVGFEG